MCLVPSHEPLGPSHFRRPHPLRTLRRFAPRCRLDRVRPCPAASRQAPVVGAGADGDPRGRTDPCGWARGLRRTGHPCRGRRFQSRAMGNGGGPPMPGPRRGDRRTLGRSPGARLHRHPAAGGRGGEIGGRLLAGTAAGRCQPVGGTRTLAAGQRAERTAPLRSQGTGKPALGGRAVPLAPPIARPVGGRAGGGFR